MTDGEYGCVIRCYPPVKDGPLERLVGKLRCAAFGTDASLIATIVLLAICKPDNRIEFSKVLRRMIGVLKQRGP